MSNRLARFRSFATHPVHSRAMNALSGKEIAQCEQFIAQFDHLDKRAYGAKCMMWMIDDGLRPKNHTAMQALVFQANLEG